MLLSCGKVLNDTMRADKEMVSQGLREAITLLCKTGLPFHKELSIEGLIGITVDQNEVLLVSIKDNVVKTLTDEENGMSVLDQHYRDSGGSWESRESTPEADMTTSSRGSKTLDIVARLASQQQMSGQNARQRKSRPSKAPRKSSTPTQILPAHSHVVEKAGELRGSTPTPPPPLPPPPPTTTLTTPPLQTANLKNVNMNPEIRAVNMNRHILKVPTTPITHHKHQEGNKVSEEQPVDLHKPKVDDAPSTDSGHTDAAAMKCAYSNNSGSTYASPESEPDFSPLTIDLGENSRPGKTESNGLDDCKSEKGRVRPVVIAPSLSEPQEEPIALTTCNKSRSDRSRTASPSLAAKERTLSLKQDGLSATYSVTEGTSPFVVVKGEPDDGDEGMSNDSSNFSVQNFSQTTGSEPHATIQSLLNSGQNLLGVPLSSYLPAAIPYALDFSGSQRSPAKGSEASLLQVSRNAHIGHKKLIIWLASLKSLPLFQQVFYFEKVHKILPCPPIEMFPPQIF